tara:strand:+ start:34 stop:582 length:549 start_codon:yes stop_codon:yes gene_type:complete
MPIAINGTGTLTGISTGGISDTKAVADAAMPAGAIIQIVHASFSTETTIASTAHTDTGLTASITPSSSSNKILVIVSSNLQFSRSNTTASGGVRVRRVTGGVDTNIYEAGNSPPTLGIQLNGFGSGLFSRMNMAVNLEDSPNTTSSCVYRVQAASSTAADNGKVIAQEEDTPSHMTLMEIAV